jgi:hypothetical protein
MMDLNSVNFCHFQSALLKNSPTKTLRNVSFFSNCKYATGLVLSTAVCWSTEFDETIKKKAPAKECDYSERDTFRLPSIRAVCGLTKVLLESHQLKEGLGARTLLISLEINKNLEFF